MEYHILDLYIHEIELCIVPFPVFLIDGVQDGCQNILFGFSIIVSLSVLYPNIVLNEISDANLTVLMNMRPILIGHLQFVDSV